MASSLTITMSTIKLCCVKALFGIANIKFSQDSRAPQVFCVVVCAGDTYEGLCKAMRGSRSMICCAKVHYNARAIINPLIMVYAIKTGCSLCMGKLQRTNDHMM